jgi:hypothetical protein
MKNRDIEPREWKPIHRWFFTILGLMLVSMGTLPLLHGKSHYQSYWGEAVFAPLVVLVGLLCWIGVFIHRK